MKETTLAQLIFEMTQNQVDMVKSINFGGGLPTQAQLRKERSLIKAMKKFGLDDKEYFSLAE